MSEDSITKPNAEKEGRPVMTKQLESKEDGRILYYYTFAAPSEKQSSERSSVIAEGAKK